MNKIIVARYGEIHLKGGNRAMFVNVLLRNLKRRIPQKVEHTDSRILIHLNDCDDTDEIMQTVTNTFGIANASVATILKTDELEILKHIRGIKITGTFKVSVTRADKTFPIKSMDMAKNLGAEILKKPGTTVDVHNPNTTVFIDIRKVQTFVYHDVVKGVGGLPVGVSGKALVLLSGGIDSPVAAFLAAKRGLGVDYLHFFSPPYTSELSLDKVKRLQSVLQNFVGKSTLLTVPFTEIQEEIKKSCASEYTITLMRRFMVRIAKELCETRGYDCIITGENLAQVASQSIQGIASNNYLAGTVPILRPLITFDKSEIIEVAKQIKTFNISTEPHPDCCTVFVPERPSIKPRIDRLEKEEEKLDVNLLVKSAMDGVY